MQKLAKSFKHSLNFQNQLFLVRSLFNQQCRHFGNLSPLNLYLEYNYDQTDFTDDMKNEYVQQKNECIRQVQQGGDINLSLEVWTGVFDSEDGEDVKRSEIMLKKLNKLYFKDLFQNYGQNFKSLIYNFDHYGSLEHEIYFKYLMANYFKDLQCTQINTLSLAFYQHGPIGQENRIIYLERFGECMKNLKYTQVSTLNISEGIEEICLTMDELDYHIIRNLNHYQFNRIKFTSTQDFTEFFQISIKDEEPKWFNELNKLSNIKQIDLAVREVDEIQNKELILQVFKQIGELDFIEEFNMYICSYDDDELKLGQEIKEVIEEIQKKMNFQVIRDPDY